MTLGSLVLIHAWSKSQPSLNTGPSKERQSPSNEPSKVSCRAWRCAPNAQVQVRFRFRSLSAHACMEKAPLHSDQMPPHALSVPVVFTLGLFDAGDTFSFQIHKQRMLHFVNPCAEPSYQTWVQLWRTVSEPLGTVPFPVQILFSDKPTKFYSLRRLHFTNPCSEPCFGTWVHLRDLDLFLSRSLSA